MTDYHHQRQCPQKENILLCPIMGLARMYPDASPSIPGTAADHPHAPRRRKKTKGRRRKAPIPHSSQACQEQPRAAPSSQVRTHSMHSDTAPERSQCRPSKEGKQNLLLIEGFWSRFN